MLKQKQPYFLWFFAALMLTGCHGDTSYNYYVQHPHALQKAITDCEDLVSKTKEQRDHCHVVADAANSMLALSTDFQNGPEKFGERVMEAEVTLAVAREPLNSAQKEVDEMKSKNASATDIRVLQEKLASTKKDVQAKEDNVRQLLAVVGMFSPD